MKLSLRRKIMLLVMGVIGALVLTSSAFLRYWILREVDERVDGELAVSERVAREFVRARSERLAALGQAVAQAPRFRAVIDDGDRRTIEDTGRDELKLVGGDLLLATARDGRELGRIGPGPLPERPPVVERALRNKPATDVWAVAGQLYLVAAHPIAFDGNVTAALTVGQRLDAAAAAQLSGLVQATAVFDPPGDPKARLPDQEYRVRELALDDLAGNHVGRVTLLRSLDQARAYLHRIQISLAIAACLVSLIFPAQWDPKLGIHVT